VSGVIVSRKRAFLRATAVSTAILWGLLAIGGVLQLIEVEWVSTIGESIRALVALPWSLLTVAWSFSPSWIQVIGCAVTGVLIGLNFAARG